MGITWSDYHLGGRKLTVAKHSSHNLEHYKHAILNDICKTTKSYLTLTISSPSNKDSITRNQ